MCSDFDKAVADIRSKGIAPLATSRLKSDCSPERWAAHLEYLKNKRIKHPGAVKGYNRKYKWKARYGISPEQYEAALEACNYTCQICGEKCSVRLAIDHCHDTQENRGLLCKKCNTGIGMFQHDTWLLENAINYLRTWRRSEIAALLRREDLDDTTKRN